MYSIWAVLFSRVSEKQGEIVPIRATRRILRAEGKILVQWIFAAQVRESMPGITA
jgi:hypothetical protein